MKKKVNEFINYEKWNYSVTVDNGESILKIEEKFYKNILQILYDNLDICYYIDFDKSERYIVNQKMKEYYLLQEKEFYDKTLYNLPDYIINKIEINDLFRLKFIFPKLYEGKIAIEMISKNEKIVIDLKSGLPIYEIKYINKWESCDKNSVEIYYNFETNGDSNQINLPDLNEYTLVE